MKTKTHAKKTAVSKRVENPDGIPLAQAKYYIRNLLVTNQRLLALHHINNLMLF